MCGSHSYVDHKTCIVRINVTWMRVRVTVVAVENISITYSECIFVVVVFEYAIPMHRLIL